jgi:hypothetical protein
MSQFIADQVLKIQVLPQGRAGVSFLNWKIDPLPLSQRPGSDADDFAGCGLYGICFDDQLIYIGSYLGTNRDGSNFEGDVVSQRWWTHIGAITSRGHKLHIAKSAINKLRDKLTETHPMVIGFSSNHDQDLLHKDNGNLGPIKRLLFAANHAQTFLHSDADPRKVLKRFKFTYVRITARAANLTSAHLKAHIEDAEKSLIKSLAPICNTTHVPKAAKAVSISSHDLERLLSEALRTS